ncbi:response regulator [Bremerella sp. JC770]|uniref:response regulator transcription factor n=1 Tax=Bremerella sp. JC770 TaxID=3232137 RepID=UPI0034584CFF
MNDSKRILIVDDEQDIREGVCYWLKQAGYTPIEAKDGDSGIASAKTQSPEAILLDVRMPEKDGIETLSDLRKDQATHQIPVVMLSASLRDELRALDAGARFFLQKPYSGTSLLSTISAVLTPAEHSID